MSHLHAGPPFYAVLESRNPLLKDFTPFSGDVEVGRAVKRGRSDLVIEDPYVSSRHALLHFLLPSDDLRQREGIVATLTDLSSNGTFVTAAVGEAEQRLDKGMTVHLRAGALITFSKAARIDPTTTPPSKGPIRFLLVTVAAAVPPLARPTHSPPAFEAITITAASMPPPPPSQHHHQQYDTQLHAYEAPGDGATARWVPPSQSTDSRSNSGGALLQSVFGFASDPKTLRKTGKLWTDYRRISELGEGAYSRVHLVASCVTGERFAAKEITRASTFQAAASEEKQHQHSKGVADITAGPGRGRAAFGQPADNVADEVAALARCSHPNLIRFVDRYIENGTTWLILELANAGELFTKVLKYQTFPEASARPLFRSLLEGVAQMHQQGVVHRDIKPENVFLHQYIYTPSPEEAACFLPGDPRGRPNVRYVPKLGDFGMARVTDYSVRGGEGAISAGGAGAVAASGSTSTWGVVTASVDKHSHPAPTTTTTTTTGSTLTRCFSIAGTLQYLCPEVGLLWSQARARAILLKREEHFDEDDGPPMFGSLWLRGVGPVWEGALEGYERPKKKARSSMMKREALLVTSGAAVWSRLESVTKSVLSAVADERTNVLMEAIRKGVIPPLTWVGDLLGGDGVTCGWAVDNVWLEERAGGGGGGGPGQQSSSISRILASVPDPIRGNPNAGFVPQLRSALALSGMDAVLEVGYDAYAADAYSLGALLYVVLGGRLLSPDETEAWDRAATWTVDFKSATEWASFSLEARDLILELLRPDPRSRLTVADALKHPWITGRKFESKFTSTATATTTTAATKKLPTSFLARSSPPPPPLPLPPPPHRAPLTPAAAIIAITEGIDDIYAESNANTQAVGGRGGGGGGHASETQAIGRSGPRSGKVVRRRGGGGGGGGGGHASGGKDSSPTAVRGGRVTTELQFAHPPSSVDAESSHHLAIDNSLLEFDVRALSQVVAPCDEFSRGGGGAGAGGGAATRLPVKWTKAGDNFRFT